MHNNMWVFSISIMIIMEIECNIPGKTSLLEFALFIKFIIYHKQRQIGHIFIWLFLIIFRRTISSRSGSHKLRNTLYNTVYLVCNKHPSTLFNYRKFEQSIGNAIYDSVVLLLFNLAVMQLEKFAATLVNFRMFQREAIYLPSSRVSV